MDCVADLPAEHLLGLDETVARLSEQELLNAQPVKA
jgi:hypothetical protein